MLPLMPVIVGPTAGGKTSTRRGTARHRTTRARAVRDRLRGLHAPLPGHGHRHRQAHARGERRGVPHHLIDVADPSESFSVERWLALAEEAIADIRNRGGVPIVAGGTHLYVKALLEGLFEGPAADEALRAELNAMDPGERRAELERVDPQSAARIHPNDTRRTVRAWRSTASPARPSPPSAGSGTPDACAKTPVLVGLLWPAESINPRINARVRRMIEDGFVEEARDLWERDALGEQSREALGYKQMIAHFRVGVLSRKRSSASRSKPDDSQKISAPGSGGSEPPRTRGGSKWTGRPPKTRLRPSCVRLCGTEDFPVPLAMGFPGTREKMIGAQARGTILRVAGLTNARRGPVIPAQRPRPARPSVRNLIGNPRDSEADRAI